MDLFAFGMALMVVLLAREYHMNAIAGENLPTRSLAEAVAEQQRAKIVDLHTSLQNADPEHSQDFKLDSTRNVILIETINGKAITFGSMKWHLEQGKATKLEGILAVVAEAMATESTSVLKINGTADPRKVVSPGTPSDNVELSALRAAAVARVVRSGSRAIDPKRVQVVGLGEDGDEDISGLSVEEADAMLQKYRRVNLEIYIDANRFSADQDGAE
ncbi:MAG: OmpA family protein [Gammaproteobacteria bacterium]|nr:OmpA family protein [Gammaproteobacteria bacterium]